MDWRERERRGGGGRSGGIEEQKPWENPLATQPGGENRLNQIINRSVRGVCVEVAPLVQSTLSHALDTHRGKKLLWDLWYQENNTVERAIVRLGARERRALWYL